MSGVFSGSNAGTAGATSTSHRIEPYGVGPLIEPSGVGPLIEPSG